MRVRLYNKEFPEGKVFIGEEEYNQALAEGVWYENFWMPSGVVPDDLKESWGDRPIEPLRLSENKKPLIKDILLAKTVPTEKPKEEEVKYCECGCGTPVKNRFVKGHSWKAKKPDKIVMESSNGYSPYNQPSD